MCEIPYVSAHLHGAQVPTVRNPLDYEEAPMITDRDARAETHAPTLSPDRTTIRHNLENKVVICQQLLQSAIDRRTQMLESLDELREMLIQVSEDPHATADIKKDADWLFEGMDELYGDILRMTGELGGFISEELRGVRSAAREVVCTPEARKGGAM